MERRSRYFVNPFNDYVPTVNAQVIDKEVIRDQLLGTANVVFTKKDQDADGGLYTGPAGITYAYLHIRHVLSEEENQYFLQLAQKHYETHVRYFEMLSVRDPNTDVDLAGFLLGKAGFHAVGAVLGKITGNKNLQEQCVKNFVTGARICKPISFLKQGSDELFVGRSGYLLCALWFQQQLGYQPVSKEDLKDIWYATLQSGRLYSQQNQSPCPLMYAYYDTEYLGAAHGLCVILQALLCFPEFIKEDSIAERDIRQAIDFYLSLQLPNGNFPCAMDEIGRNQRPDDNQLVHWCHGAPGAVYMFAKAYLTFGDAKYLQSCIACGEVVWQRGLLKKGPGICHGVAGSGYVFLLLHKLLKEPEGQGKYLYRAAKFAEFLQTDQFMKNARRPDSPYSLYEGLAGTVCFLGDLLQPSSAEFPFFNIENNYQPLSSLPG